ncbi:MAG TPA: hypothetical protein V6D07_16785 [Trichocoleus sp.]
MQPDDPAFGQEPPRLQDNSASSDFQASAADPASRRKQSENATEPTPSASGAGSASEMKRFAETRTDARQRRDVREPAKVSYRARELSLTDQVLLFFADVGTGWKRILRWVRSQLPRPWQPQLPDELLTAVILGALFLLLAIWNPLDRAKRPEATIVQAPSLETPTDEGEPASTELMTPEMTQSRLEVSPEDARITEIQEQVAEITQTYAAGLIQSVRANFQQGALFVNLGATWYDLTRSQQDQLAQDIYQRAQELTFSNLYLMDTAEMLVARNPVVGSQMVVLQRHPVEAVPLKNVTEKAS